MPGLVAFRRRWSIGSDDLALPGAIFLVLHAIWLAVLTWVLCSAELDVAILCQRQLQYYIVGYVCIMAGCVLLEASLVGVSMRGTILEVAPRQPVQYLVYSRLAAMAVEMTWLVIGVLWLVKYYNTCDAPTTKQAVIGVVICNWVSVASALITAWCTFDPAGRSWVKMKNYQRTMKDGQRKFQYKRSGSHHRNWRQRKVLRAYRDSWDHRCRLLFCCMDRSDRHQNSFSDIAQLLSEFFRDLDVVPSDIMAGVVLLRRLQKTRRSNIVRSTSNDTYEFLSGVRVTPNSRFLALNQPDQLALFKDVIYYMRFAMSIYGWPLFIMQHSTSGCCRLCPYLRCCCRAPETQTEADIVQDNCCRCNAAATLRMAPSEGVDVVYVTYHVDVGETPFMVAVDHGRRAVLVVIRGTMSTKDVVTDLECEGEPIPTSPQRDDWLGHKGMVQAAQYIQLQLQQQQLLERAFAQCPDYQLVLAGHSLGAGTAAILAILLREGHPRLRCFAFSPPGGLLSMPAVEYTKSFITSVVVGKDVVPRIGLHQLEQLRSDLMHVIKQSRQSKWRTIAGGLACCAGGGNHGGDGPGGEGAGGAGGNSPGGGDAAPAPELPPARHLLTEHPSDSSIALTVHQPLYPPGRVIHIVRHHPHTHGKRVRRAEPVYQAIWVENDSFDEVLISPVMIQDHMPDKVLLALEKTVAQATQCSDNTDAAEEAAKFPGCVLWRHVTNGGVTKDDVTNGDVTNGYVTNDDVTNGDVTNGDVTNGYVTNGDVTNGDVTNGDVTNGDVTNCDVTIDNVTNSDVSPPPGETSKCVLTISDSGDVSPQVLSCVGPAKPVRCAATSAAPQSELECVLPQQQQLLLTAADDSSSVSTLQLVWTEGRTPPTPPVVPAGGRTAAPLASPDTLSEASTCSGTLLREVLRAASLRRGRPLSTISQSPAAATPEHDAGQLYDVTSPLVCGDSTTLHDASDRDSVLSEDAGDALLPLESDCAGPAAVVPRRLSVRRPTPQSGDSGIATGGSSGELWHVTPRLHTSRFIFPGETDCEVFLPADQPGARQEQAL